MRLTFSFMRGWATKIKSLSAHSSNGRLSGGKGNLGGGKQHFFFCGGHGPMRLHTNVINKSILFLRLSRSTAPGGLNTIQLLSRPKRFSQVDLNSKNRSYSPTSISFLLVFGEHNRRWCGDWSKVGRVFLPLNFDP